MFEQTIQYKNLQEHMDFVNPKVATWYDKIAEYKQEIQKAKDIIARFDETILEKASKVSLKELSDEFRVYKNRDHLSSLREQVIHQKQWTDSTIEQLRLNFDDFKHELHENLVKSLRKFSNEMNMRFNSKGSINEISKKEFEDRLGLKTDKLEFNNLKKSKVGLEELQKYNVILKSLHDQMAHTLVILVEFIKSTLSKPNDAENSIVGKLNYLLRQAITVLKWTDNNDFLDIQQSIDKTVKSKLIKRSRESSPLHLELPDLDFDESIKIRPLNTTKNSPMTFSRQARAQSSFDQYRDFNAHKDGLPHKTSVILHPEVTFKNQRMLFSQATNR